jgi:RimJ/RimL family protein N-acetyltransferase
MRITDMTPEYATDIATWRYSAPYGCYDMTGASPAFLTDPASGFFALVDETGLIGFRSFGPDGRVPGGSYDDSALDTGGGLRPELTGRGLGRAAIATGLEFGAARFAPAAFRITVAAFNQRALRVVAALGFRSLTSFEATSDGWTYQILTRPGTNATPAEATGSR